MFAEVLQIDAATIDPDASFVDLGGNSLSYVTMSVRLERALGRLPADWHRLSLRELERIPRPARDRWPWWGATLETSVALRAAAIVLIVGSHAGLFELWGGAHLLLGIAGYNFGRFCLTPVPRADRVRHLRNTIAWIAVPSVAWVALTLMLTDDYGPTNLLLANKFLGPHDSMTAGRLWFVEVLVWILVALAVVCWLPAADHLERKRPFAFAAAFLAAGLALRYDVLGLDMGREAWFTMLAFWFFAVGWTAAKASTTWQRIAVTVVLDRRSARLLRQHASRSPGADRLGAAHLAARHSLPGRADRRHRRRRGGVAVHLSDPLSGVCALRRPSRSGCHRVDCGRRAAYPTGDGAAQADSRPRATAAPYAVAGQAVASPDRRFADPPSHFRAQTLVWAMSVPRFPLCDETLLHQRRGDDAVGADQAGGDDTASARSGR